EHAVGALDQLARPRLAILALPIVEDDLGAVPARRGQLERWRIGRHQDDRADARRARRQRHALGVIARREREDAAAPLAVVEARELVERAADLERAGLL